ncbi:MAG: BrnT family toxin [Pseudohongiella sp.]|uniref:BrnT family toxin n=1 Tax=Pseudohongiella sp. TaxID=1979412 RepID=UPI0034A04452
MLDTLFEWDHTKNLDNQKKHGVSFEDAQYAFLDRNRLIAEDLDHSQNEKRYYCFGQNKEASGVLTVRFTYRNGKIRIYGAGYWRKGRRIYDQRTYEKSN